MRIRAILFLSLAALVALALVPSVSAGPGKRALLAALSGTEETPKGGDPDGYGAAAVEARGNNRICFRIVVENIGTANAAHIHEARRGSAGPVVIPLFTGDVPSRTKCVRGPRAEIKDLLRRPANYYVNVHTADYPDGAVRGQLTK